MSTSGCLHGFSHILVIFPRSVLSMPVFMPLMCDLKCRVLFGYGPLGIKKLTVLEAGDGDLNEMTQHLPSDAVAYCFMQVCLLRTWKSLCTRTAWTEVVMWFDTRGRCLTYGRPCRSPRMFTGASTCSRTAGEKGWCAGQSSDQCRASGAHPRRGNVGFSFDECRASCCI